MRLDETDDFGVCTCGSAWFRLENYDESEGDCEPAVCIDLEGGITGYAGKLVCIECARDWDPNIRLRPARGHLRVVE